MPSSASPFVVLGGGPCGLAAAWHLARQGERGVVVEQESLVGGLCATHVKDGYRFDLGGHRFVSSDLALTSWLEGHADAAVCATAAASFLPAPTSNPLTQCFVSP